MADKKRKYMVENGMSERSIHFESGYYESLVKFAIEELEKKKPNVDFVVKVLKRSQITMGEVSEPQDGVSHVVA